MPKPPHANLENWRNDDEQIPFYNQDKDDEDDLYCYYRSDDDEDTEEFDCGFLPGHGCQLAGTEDCEFECPYSDASHNHPDYPHVTLLPSPLISFSDRLVRSEGDVLPAPDQ